jgi:hypothetical protein
MPRGVDCYPLSFIGKSVHTFHTFFTTCIMYVAANPSYHSSFSNKWERTFIKRLRQRTCHTSYRRGKWVEFQLPKTWNLRNSWNPVNHLHGKLGCGAADRSLFHGLWSIRFVHYADYLISWLWPSTRSLAWYDGSSATFMQITMSRVMHLATGKGCIWYRRFEA